MQETLAIKRGGCEAGRLLLRLHHAERAEDEREQVLQAVFGNDYTPPPRVSVTPVNDPYRTRFQAVAYLLGGTLTAIAMQCGIQRGTVHQNVRRFLPDTERRLGLRRKHQLSAEGVGVVHNLFYSLVRTRPDVVSSTPIEDIATLIEQDLDMKEV